MAARQGRLDPASRDTPLSFVASPSDDDPGLATEPTPTGGLIVRLAIEGAATVIIEPQGAAPIPLRDVGEGRFEGTVPFLQRGTGPRTIEVVVDGVRTIAPELPILWTGGRPRNVVEMPDPDSADWSIRRIPHGAMTREVYWSESMQDHCRCIVYTPPGYATGTASYPVLYLLHGFTDNETAWEYQGRLPYILDNLIADGLITPLIVVVGNGMVRRRRYEGTVVDDLFEQVLVEDCIPFVEAHHRVSTDRRSRGIAGLSMGSYMANDIGLGNPGLFAHVGQFTASMTHETMLMTYRRPFTTLDGSRDLQGEYATFFRSTTPAEDHFDYFEADDRICADTGLAALPGYHRIVYPTGTSKWRSWRLGLRDFVRAAFPAVD